MTVLAVIDVSPVVGGREYGLSFFHWQLHGYVKEKPLGTFTHSVRPETIYEFAGFGYSHWPLAHGHDPPVIVGWISQLYAPCWFIAIFWTIVVVKFVIVVSKRRKRIQGFEVIVDGSKVPTSPWDAPDSDHHDPDN
jgi:hypothetical protein